MLWILVSRTFIPYLFVLEKGHKTEEGAKFKHWAKNNFRKTTESLTGM
jgi:hypothetical protein